MTHHSILNNSEYCVFYPALVFCWVHLAIFTLKKLSQKTAEIQLKKKYVSFFIYNHIFFDLHEICQ